jgi:hypothetical protein
MNYLHSDWVLPCLTHNNADSDITNGLFIQLIGLSIVIGL